MSSAADAEPNVAYVSDSEFETESTSSYDASESASESTSDVPEHNLKELRPSGPSYSSEPDISDDKLVSHVPEPVEIEFAHTDEVIEPQLLEATAYYRPIKPAADDPERFSKPYCDKSDISKSTLESEQSLAFQNATMRHVTPEFEPEFISELESGENMLPDEGHSPSCEPESTQEAGRSQCLMLPAISTGIAEMSELYPFALGFEPDVPRADPRALSSLASEEARSVREPIIEPPPGLRVTPQPVIARTPRTEC
ncbi:uncharacterized protein EI90DRAFT_3129131 [Cantharellus anzutake]|uniref:uncharacterized protein n=1 Tax=Cantharellus anzutake TaxID=1750568 RepID=UPI0019034E67|nr:uncharacterized protein EI90DRAFT_3129131 [Cantharellus anzutake]KAF8325062.1 hypothetical protein EI90DRAFT_3129131 [Cantharellus anzutake]